MKEMPAERKIAARIRHWTGIVFALCVMIFGGLAGEAVADAAPDTGTYDDQMDLALETCWGSISYPVAWQVGDPESAGCAHSRT